MVPSDGSREAVGAASSPHGDGPPVDRIFPLREWPVPPLDSGSGRQRGTVRLRRDVDDYTRVKQRGIRRGLLASSSLCRNWPEARGLRRRPWGAALGSGAVDNCIRLGARAIHLAVITKRTVGRLPLSPEMRECPGATVRGWILCRHERWDPDRLFTQIEVLRSGARHPPQSPRRL